jgi:hypothetical protein
VNEFKRRIAQTSEHEPASEVYWITFAGLAFEDLTREQCSALFILAADKLGYDAINWCHAPKGYAPGGLYNTPTHAEVKSNA